MAWHPLNSLIEGRLKVAEAAGEMKDLPGAGKPLEFEDENPHEAVLNRLVKESGAKPPIVLLKQQIAESQARLQKLTDEAERKAEMKVMADLQTRLAIETESRMRYR
jgi:chorismate mutase